LESDRNSDRRSLTNLQSAHKAGRGYTDDGERGLVELALLANHLRIRTKALYAEVMAEYYDRRGCDVVIGIVNRATEKCGHLHPGVVITGDYLAINKFGLVIYDGGQLI